MSRATNIEAFDLDLGRFGTDTIPEVMRDRMTVIALEGTKSLVQKTPRDRGHAKGNWQVTLKRPATGEIIRLDSAPFGSSAGSPSLQETEEALGDWRPGDFVWWHNGVPYIGVLEDGTESRPAHHMLERSITHLQQWMRSS